MAPKRTDSLRTQQRMIRTAERLFADRGVESVSLSEINRASGQRNKSALHYHFGSRDGLLRAILSRHHEVIEAHRSELVDELGPVDTAPLHDLLEIAVRPVAAMLDTPDGGPEYLRIMAQLTATPTHPIHEWIRGETSALSSALYAAIASRAAAVPAGLVRRRFELTNCMTFFALSSASDPQAIADSTPEMRELLVSHLIDGLAAVLAAPPSDRTSMWNELARAATDSTTGSSTGAASGSAASSDGSAPVGK